MHGRMYHDFVYTDSVKESTLGLFESYPWLLVPIIIVTVEGWNAFKALVKDAYQRRQQRRV